MKIEKYRKANLPDESTFVFTEDELYNLIEESFSEGLYQALKTSGKNENVDLDWLLKEYWKQLTDNK